jgi:ACT domain-containing protein
VYLITLAPENSTVAYLMIIVYVEGMEEDIDRIIDSIRKVDK